VGLLTRLAGAAAREPAAFALGGFLGILPFAPTLVVAAFAAVLAPVMLSAASMRAQGGHLRVPRGASDIAAAFLGVSVVVAAVASPSGSSVIPALVLWAGYAAIFSASSSLEPSDRALRIVAGALAAGAVLACVVGLFQYIRGTETPGSWIDATVFESVKTRVYSTFDNPNVFAEYLSFALPLALALALGGGRASFLLLLPCILAMSACLLLTYSRGGWAAGAVGVAAVLAAKDRRLTALALVAVLLVAPALPQSIRSRAVTAITLADSSARYRLTIWKSALRMAADYWPSGIGPGPTPFSQVYPAYEIAGTPAAHTHNLYLQVLVEMGLPGLLSFLWLLGCFASETLRGIRPGSLVPAGLAGAIFGQMVHGWIDNIWYSPKIVFIFWATLGLALAACRKRRPT
jgi:hypothetical protein